MSFFVTVTFDLENADSTDYNYVKDELDDVDLSKQLTGKKKVVRLPSNTYAAEFDEYDFDKSTELRNYLVDEIKRIFLDKNLSGKYFINVGKKWAWKVGEVS